MKTGAFVRLLEQLKDCLRQIPADDELYSRLKELKPWFDQEYAERYEAREFDQPDEFQDR